MFCLLCLLRLPRNRRINPLETSKPLNQTTSDPFPPERCSPHNSMLPQLCPVQEEGLDKMYTNKRPCHLPYQPQERLWAAGIKWQHSIVEPRPWHNHLLKYDRKPCSGEYQKENDLHRLPWWFVLGDANRGDVESSSCFVVQINSPCSCLGPGLHGRIEGYPVSFAIGCLEGHGGEGDRGDAGSMGGSRGELAEVLEVVGERLGVVCVHVLDNAGLGGFILRSVCHYVNARGYRKMCGRGKYIFSWTRCVEVGEAPDCI